jgi:hypothetical protein
MLSAVAHHLPVLKDACLWAPGTLQLALFIHIACLRHLPILPVPIILHPSSCLYVYPFCQQLLMQLLLKAG